MSPRVNWGVLGVAANAVERTMPGMKQEPHVNLLAIASRDRAKAEAMAAEFGIPRARQLRRGSRPHRPTHRRGSVLPEPSAMADLG